MLYSLNWELLTPRDLTLHVIWSRPIRTLGNRLANRWDHNITPDSDLATTEPPAGKTSE
jgi:hypothetical protein